MFDQMKPYLNYPNGLGSIRKPLCAPTGGLMRRSNPGLSFSIVLLTTAFVLLQGRMAFANQGQETPLVNSEATATANGKNLSPQYSGCGGVTVPVINDEYEQRVVELVNQARAQAGIPPLKHDDAVTAAARYHAADQGQDDYVNHDTYDRQNGDLVRICSTWERTATFFTDPRGENIAAGYTSPEAVMEGWMKSQGHRDNILNPSSWEIGVGYFEGSGLFNYYWVQDFAQQSGIYPLIINNEAAVTEQHTVTIFIYGDWQEMRLRNDDDPWRSWQPFRSQFQWELNPGKGTHAVTAELRSGESIVISSDTITLATSNPILGNLPQAIVFNFSLNKQELYPEFIDLTPLNIGNDTALVWELSQSGDFFSALPTNGTTPDSFRVTPENFNTNVPGIYQGAITVTVTSPPAVDGSPHQVDVQLNVFDQLYWIYLPFAQK